MFGINSVIFYSLITEGWLNSQLKKVIWLDSSCKEIAKKTITLEDY